MRLKQFIKCVLQTCLMMTVMWVVPAQSEKTLRMAVNALPQFLGHPFASTARPTVFTTGAIYDGLVKFDGDGTCLLR